ncbi:MAG: type I-E CRISPR-associated protein Cas6/Cse3/CasE [Pseudomonadota bacterium]
MTAPTSLFMLHMPIDLQQVAHYAAHRGFGASQYRNSGFDEGRALHHILVETFGPGALKPFRLMVAPRGQSGSLYAYTAEQPDALMARIEATILPEAHSLLALNRLAWRAMPDDWHVGRRLAFDIRVRPVVRVHAPVANPRKPDTPYKKGAELDAWFVAKSRANPEGPRTHEDNAEANAVTDAPSLTREDAYIDWLVQRLEGIVELDRSLTRLAHFRRTRAARSGRSIEGPDATLHGECRIIDPARFACCLARGIGRHKAYGYGMLMLRPPQRVDIDPGV